MRQPRIDVSGRRAVACHLGGDDMRTLFCLTAETTLEALAQRRSPSRVEIVRVEMPARNVMSNTRMHLAKALPRVAVQPEAALGAFAGDARRSAAR